MVDKIVHCTTPLLRAEEQGCHFVFIEGVWEVTVFPLTADFPSSDSAVFYLDVGLLLSLFTKIDHAAWQSSRVDETDDLGPHLAILGIYLGRKVSLRVLASTPHCLEELAQHDAKN